MTLPDGGPVFVFFPLIPGSRLMPRDTEELQAKLDLANARVTALQAELDRVREAERERFRMLLREIESDVRDVLGDAQKVID